MTATQATLIGGPRRAGAKRQGRRHVLNVLAPVATLVIVVGLWQITSFFVSPLVISNPDGVASQLGWLFTHEALWSALAVSLKEMVIGAAIGLALGVCAGVAMSRFRSVHALLIPFVNFFNATPLIVVLPLLVIWVGITTEARVLFVVLITVWPMLLNTMAGLTNVPRGYVEVGRAFGLTENQLLWKIRIPAAVPYILAGARIAGGLAIIGMIVSEMEVSFTGVGFLLMNYGQNFEIGKLLALVIITACFGMVNVGLVQLVQRVFFRWIAGTAAA